MTNVRRPTAACPRRKRLRCCSRNSCPLTEAPVAPFLLLRRRSNVAVHFSVAVHCDDEGGRGEEEEEEGVVGWKLLRSVRLRSKRTTIYIHTRIVIRMILCCLRTRIIMCRGGWSWSLLLFLYCVVHWSPPITTSSVEILLLARCAIVTKFCCRSNRKLSEKRND